MKRSSNHPVVLIVDDERALADVYAEWLATHYTVRTAYSGSEALNQLGDAVDVVLLDRRMPDLSGDDVLDTIREQELDCRVAMVSAVEPDFDIIEMGFDDYLTKPIRKEDLHETVDHLLTRATYSEQARKHFELVSKKAVLEVEKPSAELNDSDEFARLERKIVDSCDRLETTFEELDEADFRALYRDLPTQ